MRVKSIPQFSRYIFFVSISFFLWIFLATPTFAAVSAKVGSLVKPSSAGSQSITGLGFQPKAVIFYNTDQISEGTKSGGSFWGVGFAVGSSPTNTRYVASCSESQGGGGTSDSSNAFSSSTILALRGDGTAGTSCATVGGRANMTSLDADGFTLNWTATDSTSTIVYYIALGGSDITNANVGQFTITTSTGAQSVTGVGFQPDFLMFLSANSVTQFESSQTNSRPVIGFATAATSTQEGVSVSVQDAQTTTVTKSLFSTTSSLPFLTGAGVFTGVAALQSMDADGFTITKGIGPSVSGVFYLALKGGQYKVGDVATPATTGTSSVTGVGFTPSVLFGTLTGNSQSSSGVVGASEFFSLGSVASPTSTGAQMGVYDTDAQVNPGPREYISSSPFLYGVAADLAFPFIAALNSFDSDGFTLDWKAVTGGSPRRLQYFAIGSSNVAPDAPSSLSPAGSAVSSTQPTLFFTQSDANSADTVKFEVQVSTSSSFASFAIDYTSALQAQGATSFTVGQAAGSGTYSVGSSGQTLSDGNYYWRVKSTDNSNAASSFTTANSGAVGFQVDATAPSAVGAPTFGTPGTSTISITQPSIVTENGSGLSTWQVRRNTTTTLTAVSTSTASVTDTGLSENTSYTYAVAFTDAVGNVSSYGSSSSVFTAASAPSTITAGIGLSTGITLTVPRFTNDTASSSGYNFSRSGASSGWIQTPTWTDTGVHCGESYTYTIKFRNGDGVETSPATVSETLSSCASAASGAGPSAPTVTQSPLVVTETTSSPQSLLSMSTVEPPPSATPTLDDMGRSLFAGKIRTFYGQFLDILQTYINRLADKLHELQQAPSTHAPLSSIIWPLWENLRLKLDLPKLFAF